jgi:transcriptional regulator with XRE-family HTH domain
VSGAARVSLGYLSEVERGQKEASSELLGAICTALDVPMSEVLRDVSDAMAGVELGLPYRPASRVEPVAVGELAPAPLPVTDVAA